MQSDCFLQQVFRGWTQNQSGCSLQQVFRGWTQNTDELVEQRPHKLIRFTAAAYAPGTRVLTGPGAYAQLTSGGLLSIASGSAGVLSTELQEMFAAGAQHDLPAGTS